MNKIGLIAGFGRFPIMVARNAQKQGLRVYVIAIKEESSPEIEAYADKIKWVHVGQLKKALFFFGLNRVRHLIMAGKIHKQQIYDDTPLDGALKGVLKQADDYRDDSLLLGIVKKVERLGFKFMDSTHFSKDQLAPEGVLSESEPSEELLNDMRFGFEMAKSISGLDIGQSVIVKQKAVLAVEAIEGTDQAIQRAVAFGGVGATLVKVSKPNQDMRFDVPVIGLDTIELLHKHGYAGLAIESDKTLLLDREAVLAKANECGLVVVGIRL